MTIARLADVTVLCVGLDPSIEGEEGDASNEYASGDKAGLLLPESQRRLVKAVCSVSKNVVIVVLAGSALDLEDGNQTRAVIQAWYPGAQGGRAVGDLLAGRFSPSGKLPVTFYSRSNTLPPFESYSMEGRTYRFLKEKPLYPFGYGLSFTTFHYKDLRLPEEWDIGQPLSCRVEVTNTGDTAAHETVQAYVHAEEEQRRVPLYQLCGVDTVWLQPHETREVELSIDPYWLCVVTEEGERVPAKNGFTVYIGGHQPDERSLELGLEPCLSAFVAIK